MGEEIKREVWGGDTLGGKIGKERENDRAEETDKENGRRKREVFCRDT